MSELKGTLYKLCLEYVQKSIAIAESAIKEAQQAANDDTKSSAGDKYETSREMMQQETNRYLTQLNEANKLRVVLNTINTKATSSVAGAGSVIFTDNGNFYLAISAGKLTVNNHTYFAVSPASPVGMKLKGQKIGGEFSLNGKMYRVEKIE